MNCRCGSGAGGALTVVVPVSVGDDSTGEVSA
jgi:hypothetical protein